MHKFVFKPHVPIKISPRIKITNKIILTHQPKIVNKRYYSIDTKPIIILSPSPYHKITSKSPSENPDIMAIFKNINDIFTKVLTNKLSYPNRGTFVFIRECMYKDYKMLIWIATPKSTISEFRLIKFNRDNRIGIWIKFEAKNIKFRDYLRQYDIVIDANSFNIGSKYFYSGRDDIKEIMKLVLENNSFSPSDINKIEKIIVGK
jgi:hypothetical protein